MIMSTLELPMTVIRLSMRPPPLLSPGRRSSPEPLRRLFQNRLRGRGADARGAEGEDAQGVVQRPHAAGGLDADFRRAVSAHQFQIVVGRARGTVAAVRAS